MSHRCLNHIANINEITSKAVKLYRNLNNEQQPVEETHNDGVIIVTPVIRMDTFVEPFVQSSGTPPDKPTVNIYIRLLGWKIEAYFLYLLKKQPSTTVNDEELPRNLHTQMDRLFALHDTLLDMCEIANRNFSVQIICYISVSFVFIIFGFFFETKVRFSQYMDSLSQLISIISIFRFAAGSILVLGQ